MRRPLNKGGMFTSSKRHEPQQNARLKGGLPVEFYKVFWSDISDHLLNALNYAYHKGQLSVSQKRGVIKLIPKNDTEPYHVKN